MKGMTPGKELKELKEPTQDPRKLTLSLERGVPLRSAACCHSSTQCLTLMSGLGEIMRVSQTEVDWWLGWLHCILLMYNRHRRGI